MYFVAVVFVVSKQQTFMTWFKGQGVVAQWMFVLSGCCITVGCIVIPNVKLPGSCGFGFCGSCFLSLHLCNCTLPFSR